MKPKVDHRGKWARAALIMLGALVAFSPQPVAGAAGPAVTTAGDAIGGAPADDGPVAVKAGDGLTITLEDALELALKHHPKVIEALAREESTELSLERQAIRYDVTLSAETDAINVDFGPASTRVASGFTLDRPVRLSANWQLPGGPTLTATARLQKQVAPGDSSDALRVTSRWNLWPGPISDDQLYNFQVAQEAIKEAPLARMQAINAALIETYRAYRLLQVEEGNLHLLEADVARSEANYHKARLQFDEGLLTASDLALAQVEWERALANRERAKGQFNRTLARFARELGARHETADIRLAPLQSSWQIVPFELSEDEAYALAVEASAAVKNAQRQVDAAARKVDLAERDRGWTASLTTSASIKNFGDPTTFTAGVAVTWDMLDAGAREIERRQARLDLEQAVRAFEAAELELRENVARRIADLEWAKEQYGWALQSYEIAAESLRIKEEQATLGIVTRDEVEQARTSLERAYLDVVKAYLDYEVARLELLDLCGMPINVEGAFTFRI